MLHRRVAPDRAAARRHVRGRPLAQADAGRLRLPAPVGDGQPAAALRRVPRSACRRWCSCRRRPGPYEREHSQQVVEQIVRPTGIVDPEVEVRETKHQIDDLMNEISARAEVERARAGHDADQEDGRGPDRLPARVRVPGALPALGDRHDRAHPDHPRPAARRVRRARRREPAARGARPAGGVAGRRSSTPTRRASCAARPA